MIHFGFVSALSKENIRLPISISPVLFMTHYFVSSYCCCILVLWYTFSIYLFSCVIPSCHMTMIFSLPLCTYCLSIFYRSNLRMSIGYLQPLVSHSLHSVIVWFAIWDFSLPSSKEKRSHNWPYRRIHIWICSKGFDECGGFIFSLENSTIASGEVNTILFITVGAFQ